MQYGVIMAGGSGKRLWPASRRNRPKQLIPLAGGKCLLELAVERLEGLFPLEQVLVVTNAGYAEQVAAHIPALPRENVIGEPQGRDTANAIALAAELIWARDPDGVMAVFTADHIIRPVEKFRRCVSRAMRVAEANPDALVTFGVRPTFPHTGLGYIHCGERIGPEEGGPEVRGVCGFKEKPDHHTARRYVESGEYFWNSGMFVWRTRTILAALREFLPESADRLAPVASAARAGGGPWGQALGDLLEEIYPHLPRISIDFAVMEKAPHVLMVELDVEEWLDVGSWPALARICQPDADDNAVVARKYVNVDGSRNIIYSDDDHLVAVLGMDDCIIVHTPDATLVCNRSDAQRLKELVDWIGENLGEQYV